jgi:hypothetical protein
VTGSPVPYVDSEVTAAVAARAEVLGFQREKLVRLIEELNDSYHRGTRMPRTRC